MKVFVVEDSAIVLNDLQSMLSDIPGVTVIGMAVDESHAIERINALRPDVVTLDIQLQSGSGLGVLRNVKEHHAGIKVMVLTNYSEPAYVDRCMRLGADYFFDKSLQYAQFREALLNLAHLERIDNGSGASQIAGTSPAANRLISPVTGNS